MYTKVLNMPHLCCHIGRCKICIHLTHASPKQIRFSHAINCHIRFLQHGITFYPFLAKSCKEFPTLANGYVSNASSLPVALYDSVEMHCDIGYHLPGQVNVTSQSVRCHHDYSYQPPLEPCQRTYDWLPERTLQTYPQHMTCLELCSLSH